MTKHNTNTDKNARWYELKGNIHGTAVAFSAFLLMCSLPSAKADSLVFSGSKVGTGGDQISGTAGFEFVQHNFGGGPVDALKITLTNTAASTTARGNLITGIFFKIADLVGTLPTTSTGFNGLAQTVRTTAGGATASNVDIAPAVNSSATDGTYQLSNGPFGTANSGIIYSMFNVGISTVGGGLAGFGGNAVNGDDYGIFASGSSFDGGGGMTQALPLIDTTAMFWVARPGSLTSLNQITAARLGFGSLPDNFIDLASDPEFGPPTVPEPSTCTIAIIGMIGFVAFGYRQRRTTHGKR